MDSIFSIQPYQYRIHVGADPASPASLVVSAEKSTQVDTAKPTVTPTMLYVAIGAMALIAGIFFLSVTTVANKID
jgi:hypothetical protein